jgi:predicted small lipoprotein YifL
MLGLAVGGLLVLGALGGCGQKGSLVLPEAASRPRAAAPAHAPQAQAPVEAPAAAAPAAPASAASQAP